MSESAITRADLAQELWGHDAGTQAHCREAVSYTHLTLPTIYAV